MEHSLKSQSGLIETLALFEMIDTLYLLPFIWIKWPTYYNSFYLKKTTTKSILQTQQRLDSCDCVYEVLSIDASLNVFHIQQN